MQLLMRAKEAARKSFESEIVRRADRLRLRHERKQQEDEANKESNAAVERTLAAIQGAEKIKQQLQAYEEKKAEKERTKLEEQQKFETENPEVYAQMKTEQEKAQLEQKSAEKEAKYVANPPPPAADTPVYKGAPYEESEASKAQRERLNRLVAGVVTAGQIAKQFQVTEAPTVAPVADPDTEAPTAAPTGAPTAASHAPAPAPTKFSVPVPTVSGAQKCNFIALVSNGQPDSWSSELSAALPGKAYRYVGSPGTKTICGQVSDPISD